MSEILKLKYKVGEIEFEAEGSAEAVEQQRVNFMNAVLPAAVNAMVQTRTVSENRAYIEANPQPQLIESRSADSQIHQKNEAICDFSRTSLVSFLKKYGVLSDHDFTLFAAYFDEKKNGITSFSTENVKQYYQEGRRQAYSNNSVLLKTLVQKGYIMDVPAPEGSKHGNYYMITDDGFTYIETYVPKESQEEKKKSRPRAKKTGLSISEEYTSITADDLNIKNYPAVKSLSGAKEQVIMAMYVVTNEKKGEWFTVDDIIHLLINIFEVPANIDMVNGVFKRNKSMFASEKDSKNKKAFRKKLLSGAKDFAKDIIQKNQ
ncbi:MAG: hypothetical protein J6B48_07095 [Clostridia bacterium]|nr:hypothetical protein [Clostridia bacterium]